MEQYTSYLRTWVIFRHLEWGFNSTGVPRIPVCHWCGAQGSVRVEYRRDDINERGKPYHQIRHFPCCRSCAYKQFGTFAKLSPYLNCVTQPLYPTGYQSFMAICAKWEQYKQWYPELNLTIVLCACCDKWKLEPY